ncbi:peptidylprolyl isomerase [Engelhardtia mirabilis]|uniref:Chaperone SurA n=1 Tax=Engelhardtia mirabilis TaxID=2528011 RepID=A0A518BIW2_9BACT|nr:Chaperone SurA precursor [Planctomycetes bacterium Pla133]QDV01233.1 Chaperone SurA precursor [Planctomycetes bacterium Pla86]
MLTSAQLLIAALVQLAGGAALPHAPSGMAPQSSTAGVSQESQRPSPGARPGTFDPSESLLVDPIIQTDEPPEALSLRHLQLVYKGSLGAPASVRRSLEETLELAGQLREQLIGGADFAQLALQYSAAPNAGRGGVMGTFPKGVLDPRIDEFLFSAELGEISQPLQTPTGIHVVQRVERWAAARGILIRGNGPDARAAMARVQERVEAGEDFAELATEVSQDPITAARGGALGIFERGPVDRLLKLATFEAEVGEVVGPIESPLGLHLIKRVPTQELNESLRERNWARVRAIVLIQSDTPLAIPTGNRDSTATLQLAEALAARIEAGEDFAALASEYNDDFADGRGRAGDLGWIYRRQPSMSPALSGIFDVEPGVVIGPTPTTFGWMLVKREQ